MFCLIYWKFAQNNSADAKVYYQVAVAGAPEWSPGTRFVESFTGLFVYWLGFGEFPTYLVFNMIGLAGLLILAALILDVWPASTGLVSSVPYAIVFLPGLSFWSASIGKDALAFFAVCLAAFSFMEIGHRKLLFATAVVVMFAVRPHVASVMLIAAAIALVTSKGVGPLARVAALAGVGIATALVLPVTIRYTGLGDAVTFQSAADYIEMRQGVNMEGGGGIDISSMSVPAQMFTYLFRPLFFDAPGTMGIIASLENTLLLGLVLILIPRGLFVVWREHSPAIRYNAVYAFLGLIIFATTTANLGLALRQKTMILPSIFILSALAARALHRAKANTDEWTIESTDLTVHEPWRRSF